LTSGFPHSGQNLVALFSPQHFIVRPFLEQTDFARFFWLVDFFFLLLALPQTQLQAGLRPVQGSLVLLA
jgi:hypothetical protein